MQLTNRQLMYMISLALVITLFGTALNLSRLGVGPDGLTGAAVGNISLTISKQASFNMSANISWGGGTVTAGQQEAVLDTEQAAAVNGNWSFTNVDGFIISNTGNVDLNLTVTSWRNNYTNVTFIGGTGSAYKYSVNEVGNSCIDEAGGLDNEVAVNFDGVNETQLCGNLSWTDGTDTVSIDVNITVPYNSLTGYREDTWIFSGTERTSA
ncbi:MAG: hypothetical protein ABIB47_02630 [Candidatus Woesearchaeota archaeon]